MYICPRCKIELTKGDRGHACSSCGFEIPFVFRGHRLNETEITDLVTTGATKVHDRWQTKDGGRRIRGHLQLSTELRIQFQGERYRFANCPCCKSGIYWFSHGLFCSKCEFTLFEKFAGRKLTSQEIMHLLVYKRTDLLTRFVTSEGKYFSARLVLDPFGVIKIEK